MRSYHDMGGLPAGPVERSEHDYADWERRVDAMGVVLGQKRLLTRVGHARRQIKHRLPLVIERGGDPKLVSLADTQSLAREGEIVQNGKRRGSQNGSFHPLEKHLRERTGDIHRSGAEEDPMTTRFRPGHRVGFLGREDPPERRHDLRSAPLDEHGLLGGRGAGHSRSDKRVQRR